MIPYQNFNAPEDDLFRTLGTCSIAGTLSIWVSRDDLSVESNLLEVTLTDLYDWDYATSWEDAFNAQVQAGFGTLGTRGEVFTSEIRVLDEIPEFNHSFE